MVAAAGSVAAIWALVAAAGEWAKREEATATARVGRSQCSRYPAYRAQTRRRAHHRRSRRLPNAGRRSKVGWAACEG